MDSTTTSIDGLLPQIERWFFGELNDSQRRLLFVFTVGHEAAAEATAHSTQRKLLRHIVQEATRTLGEDVVEAVADAVAVLDGLNDDEINVELLPRLRAALSSMRPVQEEGVGDMEAAHALMLIQQKRISAADERIKFLEGAIQQMCGHIRGLSCQGEDYIWRPVKSALAIADNAIAPDASHPEASPPSLGVEELRELSEKATPALFMVKPSRIAQMLRDGAKAQKPRARNLEETDFDADADFIVACVNHVRGELSRVSGQHPPRRSEDRP